jgi:hypothetical protein
LFGHAEIGELGRKRSQRKQGHKANAKLALAFTTDSGRQCHLTFVAARSSSVRSTTRRRDGCGRFLSTPAAPSVGSLTRVFFNPRRRMRLALLYPEPSKGHSRRRGVVSETKTSIDKSSISAARLSQARAVLAYSRELALAVRDGTTKQQAANQIGRMRLI